MKKTAAAIAFAALLSVGVSSAVFAQDATSTQVPGHPRVNEVDQRLQNQETRTDAGVSSGTINAKQEARDNARDAKVSQQLSADEAKNGGTVTKKEDRKMNRELNKNSKRIKKQKTTTAPATAQ